MVMFFFGICIAFVIYSTIANIICNFNKWLSDIRKYEGDLYWFIIVMSSLFWIISLPLYLTLFIMYLLKLLTDKISQRIIGLINSRKDRKKEK